MKVILPVILSILFTNADAQEKSLCPEVLKRYNSSIAARLYQLYSYNLSDVNCTQQLKIAELIHQKDSFLVYSLSAGGTINNIQKDIETLDNRINMLAPGNGSTMAEMAAQKEMAFYKTAYNLSSADSSALYKFFYNKNRSLYRLLEAGRDTNKLSSEVFTYIAYKRPVIDILNKYQSYDYFDRQVQDLTLIKPLADTNYKKLRNRYYELLRITSSYSDKERFEIAFKQTISDTSYYSKLLRSQINDIAIALNVADRRSVLRYKPSRECMDSVSKIISKKNYQIGLLALANASDYKRREAVIKKEADLYDSLIRGLLLKHGVFINSGIINAAIKHRKTFNLRNTQVDSLIERGSYLNVLMDSAWKTDAFAPYDAKDYESIWLSRIMDDDQLSLLLSMKYLRDARKNAENDWADLEKRGLIKGLSKDTAVNELTIYYIKIKSATTMYFYDQEKNSAYSKSVRASIPPSLKLLQYARKNNIVNTGPQKKIETK